MSPVMYEFSKYITEATTHLLRVNSLSKDFRLTQKLRINHASYRYINEVRFNNRDLQSCSHQAFLPRNESLVISIKGRYYSNKLGCFTHEIAQLEKSRN